MSYRKVKSFFGRKISQTLNSLPIRLNKRVPDRIWLYLEAMMKDPENKFIQSLYGPYLSQHWEDSTFRQGVLGRYGFGLYNLLVNKMKKDFVFIDIGANNGLYSFVAEKNKSCKKIYSFEPNPIVAKIFKENQEKNKSKVEFKNLAIGATNSEETLSVKKGHTGRGNLLGQGDEKITIKVRNYEVLDQISDEIGDVQLFVKIDVEGYEMIVLSELLRSKLSKKIDHLFIEVTEKWLGTDGLEQLFKSIENLGLKQQKKYGIGWQYDMYFSR